MKVGFNWDSGLGRGTSVIVRMVATVVYMVWATLLLLVVSSVVVPASQPAWGWAIGAGGGLVIVAGAIGLNVVWDRLE